MIACAPAKDLRLKERILRVGRGGEEALELAAEGVQLEIVPGVSAAIAAQLSGIP